ncbi:lipoyl(octanoyl) transferase LipB [Geomonas sp. Red875]|uniref:Octanoyltransferase n=2 Tax=Geomesophilobacter sediminis TaxID=2798584 RepID=A0A8J7M0S7_9BACT|nr:lipoyl(octanoyl) transferase LipB [Geomesophilobacter sediminis]
MALNVTDLGLIGYREALELQERLVQRVCEGGRETLLLLEHEPVYTIGSGGSSANVLDPAISAERVNRGGDVTYHGPGQLVGYPLLDLSRRGRDLHRYLRFLESFLVEVAADCAVAGFSVPGKTGVWTERGKLASIGVGVRRWVTMHGFALNVSLDAAPFRRINPCGIASCPMTSLAAEGGAEVSLPAIKELVRTKFELSLDAFFAAA